MRGRATLGPFPTELIVLGIERDRVPLEAEICRAGTTIWRPLASVPAFFQAMNRRQPAVAPDAVEPEDDEVTRLAAPPSGLLDDDADADDDDETRVLDSLLTHGQLPSGTQRKRRPPPPQRALPAPAGDAKRDVGPRSHLPNRPPPPPRHGPEALDPTPPPRLVDPPGPLSGGSAAASVPGRVRPAARSPGPTVPAKIAEATPPPAPVRHGDASRAAVDPRPAADLTPAPRVLGDSGGANADGLMDADDDELDVRGVHLGLSEPPTPGTIRPAAGVPAEGVTLRPDARRSASPPVVRPSARPGYRLEHADELTAPARRLRRTRDRLTLALVLLSLGLVAAITSLIWVLLKR